MHHDQQHESVSDGRWKGVHIASPLLKDPYLNLDVRLKLTRHTQVPTRELCDQVATTLAQLLLYCSDVVTFASLGAGSVDARRARLRETPDVLISTPGRLAEHMRESDELLKNHGDTLVIDECDLVLSYGCEADVKTIVARLSRSCQGMLLSATLDDDVNALKRVVLTQPVVVRFKDEGDMLGAGSSAGGSGDALEQSQSALKQWYLRVKNDDKDLLVYSLLKLKMIAPGKVLFFVNSIERGYRLKLFMEQFGAKSAVLNAELPANSRRHILESYEKGLFDLLIATDEAVAGQGTGDDDEFGVARGIDFRGVQTVVNVDMPPTAEGYVHRVGRTARAGASGTALSIVIDGEEDELLEAVQDAQPKKDGEALPAALALDVTELEGFRYRVDGMRGSLNKKAVNAARLLDLRNEILNSEKLQAHFQDNPRDLQLLKHDAPLRAVKVQKHLATVPAYLMPAAMVVENRNALAVDNKDDDETNPSHGAKRKANRNNKKMKKGRKRGKRDPLF